MQIADEFPDVDVIGIDLAPIQPEYVRALSIFGSHSCSRRPTLLVSLDVPGSKQWPAGRLYV